MSRRSKSILSLRALIGFDAFSIPAARGITFRSARRSKSIFFLMILIENRCFFDPGRSRDHLPIGPALEIDTFLNDFNRKSMFFLSRPLMRSLPDRPVNNGTPTLAEWPVPFYFFPVSGVMPFCEGLISRPSEKSRMRCLNKRGRESWDWAEQKSLHEN